MRTVVQRVLTASVTVDGKIVGEIEVPVFVQAAPQRLPKDVEDGFRKSDVIWVGVEGDAHRQVPVWFAYANGKILLLSQKQAGPQEQTVPGIPGAREVQVVTRRKGRDTALDAFPAAVRLLDGPEWEQAAKTLVDRRRSRVGPPAESIQRWRGSVDIAELTPIVD